MGKFTHAGIDPVANLQENLQGDMPQPEEGFLARYARTATFAEPQATPEGVASSMVSALDETQGMGSAEAADAMGEFMDPVTEQIQRESIPDIRQRINTLQPTTFTQSQLPYAQRDTGNIYERAARTSNAFQPALELAVDESTGEVLGATPNPNVAQGINFGVQNPQVLMGKEGAKPRPLVSALSEIGVYDERLGSMDPLAAEVMSLVVENGLMESAYFLDEEAEFDPGATPQLIEADLREGHTVAPTSVNTKLGQQFAREMQRIQGAETTTKIDAGKATLIGDAMMKAYAAANPDMLVPIKEATVGGNKKNVYQVTAFGAEMINRGSRELKRVFPKNNFRPLKNKEVGEAKGEARNEVKAQSGKVGKVDWDKTIKEAMKNLSTIPNVVDRTRLNIALSTILPLLQAANAQQILNDPLLNTYANMYNMGSKKYANLLAQKEKLKRTWIKLKNKELSSEISPEAYEAHYRNIEEAYERYISYNPDVIFDNLRNNLAQAVFSAIQEKDGANYLTYFMQNFSGRISPQQTVFDPTSNKMIRFVTRNATPVTIKYGSRQHNNIQQMYAMMLVSNFQIKDPKTGKVIRDVNMSGFRDANGKPIAADALLFKQRMIALNNAHPMLYSWGQRLQEIYNGVINNDNVIDGISQGQPLSSMGTIPMFGLDPEADADLIAAIASKGEDGPHFIDGLMDDVKYHDRVMVKKQPYHSYFNAYIDGKTNGLAANSLMMGDERIARASGVLRNNTVQLLDDGDIRDQLKRELLAMIDTRGIEYKVDGFTDEELTAFYKLSKEIVGTRDLNKYVTMTFGYGRDMASFKIDIANTALDIQQEYLARGDADPLVGIDLNKMAEAINRLYTEAFTNLFSPNGIEAKSVMKASAFFAALNDSVFTIKGPTGLDLMFGGKVFETYEEAVETAQKYSMNIFGEADTENKAYSYGVAKVTAAATGKGFQIARAAMNGSVVAPVQAVDAATVGLTLSGKSWQRLVAASGGNPYVHTIYDAFKMDANGYDVIMEEANSNWLETCKNYNYIDEAFKANSSNITALKDKIAKLPPNVPVSIEPNSEYAMFGAMLDRPFLESIFKSTLDFRDIKGDRETVNRKRDYRVFDAVKKVYTKFGKSGASRPSTSLTPQQLTVLLNAVLEEMQVGNRMKTLRNKINEAKFGKDGLFNKINPKANLQYYSH